MFEMILCIKNVGFLFKTVYCMENSHNRNLQGSGQLFLKDFV